MRGLLTLEALRQAVAEGAIDTVVLAQVDMQGRLMGKRLQAEHFLETGWRGTNACTYLLATDLEMGTVPGYAETNWSGGYGDHALRPDLATLRVTPWLPGTALVLADVLDGAAEAPHAPRTLLRRQTARLADRGWQALMASELEFYLFRESFEALQERGHHAPTPMSPYNQDYHVFQTTREEEVLRAIRTGLFAAGVPIEGSRGEASAGQGELNIRYLEALAAADAHAIAKNGAKEIAWARGRAMTFMAKWDDAAAGSSAHVHLSLAGLDGAPVFPDPGAEHGMSAVMRAFLAGLLAHAAEITVFLAPYVNSYKRFQSGSFAPTRAVWSFDNRTAGFRVCGAGGPGLRVECRIGGADLTPHLAYAALIAAGLAGVEAGLELAPAFAGDAYSAPGLPAIPATLRAAAAALEGSAMLRAAFGDGVVDHYVHAARWECSEADRRVSSWDLARGFERA